MHTITINLLPVELEATKKDQARKVLIIRISIGALALMIGVSLVVLTFGLSQSLKLKTTGQNLDQLKNSVSAFKDREGLIVTLKSRLDSISTLARSDSQAAQVFALINSLTPVDIKLTSLSFTPSKMSVSGETANPLVLEAFFSGLVDPSKNQGKIQSVKIGSLSKGPDSIRFDLDIFMSGK